jgi:hypothetical protein
MIRASATKWFFSGSLGQIQVRRSRDRIVDRPESKRLARFFAGEAVRHEAMLALKLTSGVSRGRRS